MRFIPRLRLKKLTRRRRLHDRLDGVERALYASNPGIHREDRVICAAVPCNEGEFSPRVFTLVGSIRGARKDHPRNFFEARLNWLPRISRASLAAVLERLLAWAISPKSPGFTGVFARTERICEPGFQPLFARFPVRPQAPDSHLRTPVEMNVLLSQPKSSQSGMVDATGYANII